jgi:hypothetical protein
MLRGAAGGTVLHQALPSASFALTSLSGLITVDDPKHSVTKHAFRLPASPALRPRWATLGSWAPRPSWMARRWRG